MVWVYASVYIQAHVRCLGNAKIEIARDSLYTHEACPHFSLPSLSPSLLFSLSLAHGTRAFVRAREAFAFSEKSTRLRLEYYWKPGKSTPPLLLLLHRPAKFLTVTRSSRSRREGENANGAKKKRKREKNINKRRNGFFQAPPEIRRIRWIDFCCV